MSDTFMVDGILYDEAEANRRQYSGGIPSFTDDDREPWVLDECLCGTGFVCVVHRANR